MYLWGRGSRYVELPSISIRDPPAPLGWLNPDEQPNPNPCSAAAATTDAAAAAAAAAAMDESGTSASGGGGGLFAGFGLGSFGLGGDLSEESEDEEGPWAVTAEAGDAQGRYNLAHWQSLLGALQQARHPRYYDEVGVIRLSSSS